MGSNGPPRREDRRVKQQRVREALTPLLDYPLRLEPQGSKIIYIED